MSIAITPAAGTSRVLYAGSDGRPMADNTLKFRWIGTIQGGLASLFRERDDVFVAGDLLWYPVEGQPGICVSPDILVAFGRPKGDRGSYRQWEEDDIAPQVVFEVLSPGNRAGEMLNKFLFYDRYGVEEYYIYNPDTLDFSVVLRDGEHLAPREFSGEFTSPRLGVRFVLPGNGEELVIYRPDGRRFLSFVELEAERANAEARAEKLAARLRELGVDPDSL